jgi:hypothetical protein
MYPAGSVTITSMTVKPGDSMTASVAYNSTKNDFVLTIADTTEHGIFSTTQSIKGAARSSAEWVVEAPSSNSGILPLANFGTVKFINAYATVNGTTGPIDNAGWQVYSINMESGSRVEDSTSALSDSGAVSSFTVTYTATSPVTPTPTPPPKRHEWDDWGGWGWAQTDVASPVVVGHTAGSSESSAAVGRAGTDYLLASSELLDSLWQGVESDTSSSGVGKPDQKDASLFQPFSGSYHLSGFLI